MQTITDYTVIHGTIADGSFERLVAARLSAGYQPYGSPFFSREQSPRGIDKVDRVFCHQAMVKQGERTTHVTTLPEQISVDSRPAGSPSRYLR